MNRVRSFSSSWTALLAIAAGGSSCAQESKPQSAPSSPSASAQDTPPSDAKDKTPSDFARFVEVGEGGHFDTAITTYRDDVGVEVAFFGAVHIADGRHYEELQKRFEAHEALLYELVGEADYRPRQGEGGTGSFVSMMQNALKSGLELSFQLDAVDYSAANFVHADMTPKEFEESMEERGESLMSMLVTMSLQGARLDRGDEEAPPPVDLAGAFRSGEGRHRLRMMLAQQLESMEALASGGSESTLLQGRNEKCLTVLQQQIAAGKQRLGIYYGAAHLPHLEQRLTRDLGFRKVDHEWLVAWDCTKRADPKADRNLWMQRRKAKDEVARIAAAARLWLEQNGADVPTLSQLTSATTAADSAYRGSTKDPWGNDYRIDAYAVAFDVRSSGQDRVDGTDDDIHSATASELRRMQRAGGRRGG